MFSKPMRIPLLIAVCLAFVLTSCGEYQRVLRKDDISMKYNMADSLYVKGKYKKSLKLMEQIVPAYRGKPQAERLMFIYANTFYELGDYFVSGYQFERFTQSYPTSDSLEVAAFKSAKSFYQLSERYSLDQTRTSEGLEKLQAFINRFPNSDKRVEANELVSELRMKLDRKQFEIAKQYLQIEEYKAAIEAFDNFIGDHPGTEFRERAFLLRLQASYGLAVRSIPSLVQERLLVAKGHYNSFKKYYTDSDLAKEADKINQEIEERLIPIETEEEVTTI